jgi:hypothetical protein
LAAISARGVAFCFDWVCSGAEKDSNICLSIAA